MGNNKAKIIERTVELWKRRGFVDISSEDARQIIQNIAGYFDTLARWSNEFSSKIEIQCKDEAKHE